MNSHQNVKNEEEQMELYDRIKKLCDENGISPSGLAIKLGFSKNIFTEIKSGRVKSLSAHKLSAIAEYFNVKMEYFIGGQKNGPCKIPVYGSVPAGIPVEAIEDITDYEEISPELAASGKFIALKVKGDSMMPGICSGDTVIVKLQDDADTGDTVVAMINGEEATCKKLKKDLNGIWLLPSNPAYDPMYYTNSEIENMPVRILGKIVELRRTF